MATVYLGLGSNIDAGRNLRLAMGELRRQHERVARQWRSLSDEQLAHAQPVLPVAVGLAEWGLV